MKLLLNPQTTPVTDVLIVKTTIDQDGDILITYNSVKVAFIEKGSGQLYRYDIAPSQAAQLESVGVSLVPALHSGARGYKSLSVNG